MFNRSPSESAEGVKPDDIKTKLVDCLTTVQAAEQSQANAKTALKVATQTHSDTVAQRYPEFSSVIDVNASVKKAA